MSVLLTLPPHLLEKIEAILAADLGEELPSTLRAGLGKAQRDVEEYQTRLSEANSVSIPSSSTSTPIENQKPGEASEEIPDPQPDAPPPPTIDEEALIALSKWATSDIGPVLLKRKSLDPLDYSLISLLAGTVVYVPPAMLARLRAADNPDKPDPFLPSYLSPTPPSLGSEYRALTRNLSTALNILFSIFGSAGAVYAASVGGAGYSRETAMLLAILAGAVVGVADGVLVWIFSAKVGKSREEGERLGRAMLKGSAVQGTADEGDGDGQGEGESAEGVSGAVLGEGEGGGKKKRKIRLRRRAVGDQI